MAMANQGKMKVPTERPLPLTWEQIAEDVRLAKEDDVVFRIGRGNAVSPSAESPPKGNPANISSSGEGDGDSSFTDPAQVRDSCDKVLRLLTLYKELKDVPAALQERYGHLKNLREEMTQSIEQLKSLSQTIVSSEVSEKLTVSEKQGPKPSNQKHDVSSHKGKSKHKKKK